MSDKQLPMTESSKSKLWWFAGLLLRLPGVLIICIFLSFLLELIFIDLGFSSRALFWLSAIGQMVGYTWAIYFDFPFFPSRTKGQRQFISASIALLAVFLTYFCITAIILRQIDFSTKTDKRTESVQLPSGEILENQTYYDASGREGEQYNKLFLKNPATGTSGSHLIWFSFWIIDYCQWRIF